MWLLAGRQRHEEVAAQSRKAHATAQRAGEVEDMLQRAAVEDERKPFLQFGPKGLVEIVDEGCALERRGVQRVDRLRAERLDDGFAEAIATHREHLGPPTRQRDAEG